MQSSTLTQIADWTSLPEARHAMPQFLAQDSGKSQAPNSHNPKDSREILPPGKLQREDGDSALTGITRSLQRRLLGLRDFAKRRSEPPVPPDKMD